MREETDSKTNVLLTEQIRKPVRKMTIIKPLFNQQISSLDLSKNRTETKHILSSDATIEQNIKSLI